MAEIVGIVPAAGFAARLQPLECSKEMLPVGGRPVIDHLVERMWRGGCSRVRVVTRPAKEDVVVHASELGAEVVIAEPASVTASLETGMAGLDPRDIVLIGFPDTLWEPPDGYATLVPLVDNGCDAALGLFQSRPIDLVRSDVVVVGADGRVVGVHVRPARPPSDWIWGCAAARMAVMSRLSRVPSPGAYFDELCRAGADVRGAYLSDVWLDVGTPEALALAQERLGAGTRETSG